MGFLLDIHCHTRRHSGCSSIDEHQVINQAISRGLDGLILTEHHYQWSDEELDELRQAAGNPDFLLMAAFEYSSAKGDILVYGLQPDQVEQFEPGGDPEEMLRRAQELGAVCVAAHPTRRAIPFDQGCLRRMPINAVEVRSVNLRPFEQAEAEVLAGELGLPHTGASDAHRLEDVGAYATEFEAPIMDMAGFLNSLKRGAFRPATLRP